mgnify:CR=1 FL=1
MAISRCGLESKTPTRLRFVGASTKTNRNHLHPAPNPTRAHLLPQSLRQRITQTWLSWYPKYKPIHTRSRVSNFLPVRVSITIPSVLNKVLSYEPKNSFIKAGGDSSFFLPFLHRFGCKLLLAIRIRNSINYKQLETFTETTTSFRSKQNYELYKYTFKHIFQL